MVTIEEFLANPPVSPVYQGSSVWARHLNARVQGVIRAAYYDQPRSRQRTPGPSQLGSNCDRQIVAQFLGLPPQNFTTDPWAAVVGTAVHAWLADAFERDGMEHPDQWLIEHRVKPLDTVGGQLDLYARVARTVIDHKVLGATTLASLKAHGPPVKYVRQLMLYLHGLRQAGEHPERIAIIGYARAGRLTDTYVWESPVTAELEEDLQFVLSKTTERQALANEVRQGTITLDSVPISPSRECHWCSFYVRAVPDVREEGAFCCTGTA